MEIVYILTNEAMSGYVKIGRTTDLKQRLKSLYRTPVPLPFECFYACTVENAEKVERWLFEIFDDRRVSREREFFEIAPERIFAALQARAIKEVTPQQTYTESEEDKTALKNAHSKKDRFNFSMVGIPVGAELTFVYDKDKKAKVVDSTSIEYEGKIASLSKLARQAGGYAYPVNGTMYWMFEGETLDSRRKNMEEEE